MLTGYFPPTTGTVLVNGMDMLSDPIACKRLIGYLPERPPLYDEMTVRDYLVFVSRLRQVRGSAIKNHIQQIMDECGLLEVEDKLIGALSKGYRQRTGIAQALCGDPPVLVLDEPTVGLDPRQVVEMRELIRRMGEKHTVVFSSHILSEIQQLCHRIVILHKGQLVADVNATEGKYGNTPRYIAVINGPREKLIAAVKALPGIQRVHPLADTRVNTVTINFEVDPKYPGDVRSDLFHACCAMNTPILELKPTGDSL